MRTFLIISFAALIFSSCKEEESLPISSEKLVLVLRDVHIAESAIQHLRQQDRDSILNVYYEQICQIHGVERSDLDSSIAVLKREPSEALQYYEKVLEELEKLNLQQE